ncbi:MAG TPA: hypothetical protein DCY86_14300 [Bdellovibrionales bacterium]|nr:hypothetical protein [Bdellovibrionales bacterium]
MSTRIFVNNMEVSSDWLKLTRRQQEILLKVVQGLSNREIAKNLHITEQTVKDHMYNIFRRLGVCNRTQLVSRIFGRESNPTS